MTFKDDIFERHYNGAPSRLDPLFYAVSGSYTAILRATTVEGAIKEVRLGQGEIDKARDEAAEDKGSLEDPQTWDIFRFGTDEEVANTVDVTY